jgi:hypothetical protein
MKGRKDRLQVQYFPIDCALLQEMQPEISVAIFFGQLILLITDFSVDN